MIITKAPLRMSFIGGGTDLASFYQSHTGSVISTSINKYVYITVHDRFEPNLRLAYSDIEIANSVSEIKHPLIRNVCLSLEIEENLEISSIADIPASGTGLGSSSSFTVALIEALSIYKGKRLTKSEIAELACKVEIELCGQPIGKQDQYAASFGGIRRYDFHSDGTVTSKSLFNNHDFINYLEKNILVLFTGKTRSASSILSEQSKIKQGDSKFDFFMKMISLVDPFEEALVKENLVQLGSILHEGWQMKKNLVKGISDNELDIAYQTAIDNGAIGGKLLGAGAGGFFMFIAPLARHKHIIDALPQLRHTPIGFDKSGVNKIFGE